MQGIFGKHSVAVAKQNQKIVQVEQKISDNQAKKINEISQLNYGTMDALKRVTNSSPPIDVANEMATRVESLAGLPTVEQQAAMSKMIADLIATNKQGLAELKQKDFEISALQQEEQVLVKTKQDEMNNALQLSAQTAMQADASQSQLNQMNSLWGIGAIWYGIKRLIIHLLWTIGISIVLFILLRALSMTNPFLASIFYIFQSLASAVIHAIETIIPGSISTLNEAKNEVLATSNAVNKVIQSVPVDKI
jgi:cellobiose-specific phosphotransferase system component IIB